MISPHPRQAHASSIRHAVLAGGARRRWGRGCVLGLGVLASAASAQNLEVPSGQPITLSEVLVDDTPGDVWVRFRFLAPQIAEGGGTVDYNAAAADMDHLCGAFALPYIDSYDLEAVRVVISLSDRAVAFGESDPEATQFFEAYRPEGGRCIWEEF